MQSRDGPQPAGADDQAADGGSEAGPPDDVSALAQLAAERRTALERERWLRRQVERERETLELIGKRLAGVLERESGAMRFWRWLIDDLRSEAREQVALVDGRRNEGLLPRLRAWLRRRNEGLLPRLRAWLRRRRRGPEDPPPPDAASQ